VETGDEVPRPACGVCDGGRSDIGGSLTGTDWELACWPDNGAAAGGGGMMSAAGSTSITLVQRTPGTWSDSGGGGAIHGSDTAASWSVSDGGGGTMHARYGANDGLTMSSNVELVVLLTHTSSASTVSVLPLSTALPGGLTTAARRSWHGANIESMSSWSLGVM